MKRQPIPPPLYPEALKTVLDLIAYEFSLDKIHIRNEIKDNLPLIQCDQRQLEEILFNLIVNAAHAMKKEGGELVIASLPATELGGQAKQSLSSGLPRPSGARNDSVVRITIQDTGTGIPPDHLKHLFEPFHTTKGKQGTGLGLYITKQLIERNGGRISVKSQEGKGSLFKLEFMI